MVRTVLVTGATSGVGLETALRLARSGFRVVGTARSEEKAQRLAKAAGEAGVEVETVLLDVTDADGCREVVAAADPWAVVNNAGYMNAGAVVDVTDDEARLQLEAMVVAPMRLARLALPAMRRRGEGRIVNVSSVTAHTTGAMTGWYQGCKQALSAVTDALRREVAGDGVDVVLIEPGGLDTGIWARAEDDLVGRRSHSAWPGAYDRSLAFLRKLRPLAADPARAAEAIVDALTAERPRSHYRVGRDAPVIQVLDQLLPTRIKDLLARGFLGR